MMKTSPKTCLCAAIASTLVILLLPAASPAAPPAMSVADIICRAQSGVGFSYNWGGECWCSDGCSPDFSCNTGNCTGYCPPPNCTHTGTYGADCSGFVSKVWQVPNANATSACNVDRYVASSFSSSGAYWNAVNRNSIERGDALASSSHVVLYERGDPWGSLTVYEAQGCEPGIVHDARAFSDSFHASRRTNIVPDCTPAAEICDGVDNDCDGSADEDAICLVGWDLDSPESTDVDGDGKADICARAAAGIRCYLSTGSGFSAALDGPGLADDNGWGDITNCGTIRMGDVSGDGLDDVCARANNAVYCWLSDGSGFPTRIEGPPLGDDSGWGAAKFWGTMKLADFNGDGMKDVCARAAAGWRCYPSTGAGFGSAVVGPTISDDSGWGGIDHWATIRMGDVNGDGMDDVCARGAAGMFCWLSDGSGFPTRIEGPVLSDEGSWNEQQYWSTIKLADFNGDGMKDICARGYSSFQCYPSTGTGFGGAVTGPEWSDASGWNDISNYGTIRMDDVNGDGLDDVCARANATMVCWLSDGSGFPTKIDGPDLSDDSGWGNIKYWSTIRLADIHGDGMADICARAAAGIRCYPSTGTGFDSAVTGPELSNAAGWGDPNHHATIRIATSEHRCVPQREICGDGVDNDCDGQVDEDCTPDPLPDAPAEALPDAPPDGQTDPLGDTPQTGDTIIITDIQGDDAGGPIEIRGSSGGCGCSVAR